MDNRGDTPGGRAGAVWRDLAVFAALAALVRALFWLAMGRVIDSADAIHYIETAQHLAAGDFAALDPKIPLGYPLAIALAHIAVPDIELAARCVSLLASTLLILPVYLLARRLHGVSAARVAAFTLALWPWFADYGSRVSTESLACLMWLTGGALLAAAVQGRKRALPGAAAAFFGLALTRPEGAYFCAAAVPAALILAYGARAAVKRLLIFAAILASLALAYGAMRHAVLGGGVLTARTASIVEDLRMGEGQRGTLGMVVLFARTVSDSLLSVIPTMLGPVLMLLLGVGAFMPGEGRREARLELYWLALAAVQWALTIPVFSPAPRYLMSVILLLSLWAARGAVLVGNEAARLPRGRWWRLAPVAAIAACMCYGHAATLAAEHLGRRPRQPREYKVAGEWMKRHLEPGLVYTRKPQTPYYAGMPSTGPSVFDTFDEALRRARGAGARYVVVDERYTVQIVPALRPLLDPANAPPGLVLRHEVRPDYPEARVLIYEFVEPGAAPVQP